MKIYSDSDNTLKKQLEPINSYDPALISTYLNGAASEAFIMVKLMGQVVAILITGLILWRISAIFGKKKKNRRKSVFSESRFQQHWRKK